MLSSSSAALGASQGRRCQAQALWGGPAALRAEFAPRGHGPPQLGKPSPGGCLYPRLRPPKDALGSQAGRALPLSWSSAQIPRWPGA